MYDLIIAKKKSLKKGKGYFTILLLTLIALFIFRPYERSGIYLAIWQLALIGVYISAVFSCNHTKRFRTVAFFTGACSLVSQLFNLAYPTYVGTFIFLMLTTLFLFGTTSAILKKVVVTARVKLETLQGVICAYFMLAFGFSFAYTLTLFVFPDSFDFSGLDHQNLTHLHILSELMYFSFVTILCIGYGDIVAASDFAKTLAIMEGVVGQFYIAMLVSRLVAVYSYFENKLYTVKTKRETKKQDHS